MDKNSNTYTFIFASVLVIIVAALLTYAATGLKPFQDENIQNEKMQNILSTLNIVVEKSEIENTFNLYIKEQLAIKADGSIDPSVIAFKIDLKKELKKPLNEQRLPLYIAEKDGKKFYIIPLFGAGLWDAIWGYIAFQSDKNTIEGAIFDHKAETPGLGAEIRESSFSEQFMGKSILLDPKKGFTEEGNYVSVKVVKGGVSDTDLHGVDAISGGTITSVAVSEMVHKGISNYLNYFQNN